MSEATRESIFAAATEMPFANVMVQQWGGSVRVYGLSADDTDAFHEETARRYEDHQLKIPKGPPPRVRVRLLIATVRDQNDNLLFNAGDEEALAKMPARFLKLPWVAAADMCGFNAEEDDDGGNS